MPSGKRRDSRRRELAQNFIRDPGVARAIVDLLDPWPGAAALDLGAGSGALTEPLARRGAAVTAVELDPRWAAHLKRKAPGWGRVEVRQADALSTPLPGPAPLVVCNAPYNLGTKLVRRVMRDSHGLTRAVFLLQDETARRLAGSDGMGLFTATWVPWFELETGMRVGPEAFRPRPSVLSATLVVRPREAPLLSPAAFGEYGRFLGRLFADRRETVLDRLSAGGDRRGLRRRLKRLGLDAGARPSDLAPAQLVALFRAVGSGRGESPAPALSRPPGSGGRGSRRRRRREERRG